MDTQDTYDNFQVMAQLLRLIKYNLIASYMEKYRDRKILGACVDLVIRKTPIKKREYVFDILYVCGLILVHPFELKEVRHVRSGRY